ncbi:diguanylate cyclase [Lysobacter lacus]|uniref:Diguanylate cyclase n=2 Tax=Cognatilysobacter lacus TaxID=1643323 RepID=A0A5D8Z7Z8_9GAMM|nr:diguanylate cyclase [Lysobacter lacus]
MPDVACVVDPDGVLLYVSAAFERVFGYTRDEVLGRHVFDLVHPEDREATREQAARLMEGLGARHFRNRYVHRAGHAVDLLWSAQWLPEHGVRVAVGRDVTELRRLERELEHRANHDALTGLANRQRLHELLEHAIADASRTDTPLALLYIDIDAFKAVNDAHGHEAGDRVLVEVARRLQAGLWHGGTVARMGGDEFVALLPGCDDQGARGVIEALHVQLLVPFGVAGGYVPIGASIGAAAYPADAQQPDALINRADSAMYACKRRRAPAVTPA